MLRHHFGSGSSFAIVVILLFCSNTRTTAQHFRGGVLQWKEVEGNTVGFIFSATFKRSYGGFSGTGEQGYPGLGDQVTLSGQEPILFYPGISASERGIPIDLAVTSIDVVEDTFQGFWTTEVTFPEPSFMGIPWRSRVSGCCRFSGLQHAANSHFELTAAVNLEAMIGNSTTDSSGSIASVATLRVLPGYGETGFPIVHPLLPPIVDCSTAAARACVESAKLLNCDLDTLLYPVEGVDCSPFLESCIRPACDPLADDDARAATSDAPPPASAATPEALLGLFVRQVLQEEGGSSQPHPEHCRGILENGGAAACALAEGCCWEEQAADCQPCISVSPQGVVTTAPNTPPGLYPLSLALSAVPRPAAGACLDAVLEWRSRGGLRCSELWALGQCAANGTDGALGSEVCCECGGGRYPAGPPDAMTGIEGEYRSGSCVNASSAFANAGGGAAGPRVFWNATLGIEVSRGRFRARFVFEEFAAPPANHSLLARNATAPCSAHVALYAVEAAGVASVDARDASSEVAAQGGPKRVWVAVDAVKVAVRSREGEVAVAERCGCLGLNATALAEAQAREAENYTWAAEVSLEVEGGRCNATTCQLLRRAGVSDEGVLGFEYEGRGGWPVSGACAAELRIPGPERRRCGWEGVQQAQCEALGCCWDAGGGGEVPACSERTWQDLNASVRALRCDAAAHAQNQSCGSLSRGEEGGGGAEGEEVLERVRREEEGSSWSPPPAMASTELLLSVEPPAVVALHAEALGAARLAELNVTLHHGRTALRSEALEAFADLESRYQLRFSPRAWRVYSGAHPGTLHYVITHADVPSTSTPAPEAAATESGGEEAEEPALSEVRVEWSHLAGAEEVVDTVKCFQARLLLSCVDTDSSWQDERGRNCSTLHSLSLCPGLAFTSPSNPPLSPPPRGPLRPRFVAREVCCACGGGHIQALWTEQRCVPVLVKPDPPPKLFLSAQPVVLREPCEVFPLGHPPVPVRRCSKPVLSPPCRPPFDACVDAAEGAAVTYPRRVREAATIGEVADVLVLNGGLGCSEPGFLGADPKTSFGHGFSARFEIAAPGTFRGTSGAITSVHLVDPGSGYRAPPRVVIASGGAGCSDAEFQAVLSSRRYQLLPVYPGVGLDVEIVVGDVSFQDVTPVTVSPRGLDRMPQAELSAPTRAAGWASRRLTWQPSRAASGDYPFPLCLDASDRGEVANKTVAACLALHVVRCQYAIREEETIEHVAAYYNTNWIQIWSMNPGLVDPDGVLDRGHVISFGHVHVVGEGELLGWLIRKFGLSYEQIFSINADLAQKELGVIGQGQDLCLIPNSCSTNL